MPDDPDKRLVRRPPPKSGPVEDYQAPEEDPEGPSDEDVERFSDVTIKCPECGSELFDDVAVCWKCGRPVGPGAPGESKTPLWVVATVIIVILGFLLFLKFGF